MSVALTHEGEIILVALQSHRVHLESHKCDQCMEGYQTLLEAITAWVKRIAEESKEAVATSQAESSMDNQEYARHIAEQQTGCKITDDPLAVFGVKK